MEGGRVTDVSLLQLIKAPELIELTEDGTVTVIKLIQLLKA